MWTVAALYKFSPIADPEALRAPLTAIGEAGGVKGSLLLATEGVNGTIAGPRDGVDAVLDHLRKLRGFGDLDWKESRAREMPFRRLKVRLKREIVSMGQPGIDPRGAVGTYVAPEDWNALISAPDVTVIDTRNEYEVAIGTFEGAVDPHTERFRDFPAWWEANRDRFDNRKIAMFCTGGIRCEKSTAYLKAQGVDEVYHLQGGILKYLEDVPEDHSLWHGGCFVFDERVAVGHGLRELDFALCRACGKPLSVEDRKRPEYEAGVQCHRCVDAYSDEDRARFRERQRQMDLSKSRSNAKGNG